MRILLPVLLFAVLSSLRADQAVADAQRVLKEQGFYYGEVSGERTADTSAAIRRYQIRNGLEITGELNDETLQALRKAPPPASAPVTSAPAATVQPPARTEEDNSEGRDQNATEQSPLNPSPSQPFAAGPPPQAPPNVYPGRVVSPAGDGSAFAGTPYETAPPEVQRRVVVDAQRILARRGLFKYAVDGVIGPDMQFSLRAYQSRVGLRPTGRLDLETLAALELLPGAHERVYTPRRSYPPGGQPPVRGEWIRP